MAPKITTIPKNRTHINNRHPVYGNWPFELITLDLEPYTFLSPQLD